MELALLVGILCLTIAVAYAVNALHTAVNVQHEKHHEDLESLGESLSEKILQLQITLAELDDRLLSPAQRMERRFYGAADLTLLAVQKMRQGQIFRLTRRSFNPPSEEAHFDEFEYRHDHLGEPVERPHTKYVNGKVVETTKRYTPVRGFVRWDAAQEWMPVDFLAAPDECVSSGDTIKRLSS